MIPSKRVTSSRWIKFVHHAFKVIKLSRGHIFENFDFVQKQTPLYLFLRITYINVNYLANFFAILFSHMPKWTMLDFGKVQES